MAQLDREWYEQRSATGDASPFDLRDMLVSYFACTHGPRFGEDRRALGLAHDMSAVRSSIRGMVSMAFDQVGGSYEEPTIESLGRVASLLAERSLGWGCSVDEVFEDHCLLTREIGRLAARRDAKTSATRA